jgi:hypothetical protein
MGEWLFGASALSGSTPNWIVLVTTIAVCFFFAWLARS